MAADLQKREKYGEETNLKKEFSDNSKQNNITVSQNLLRVTTLLLQFKHTSFLRQLKDQQIKE